MVIGKLDLCFRARLITISVFIFYFLFFKGVLVGY